MCQQIVNAAAAATSTATSKDEQQRKMKPNYSLKKVFKILFKKQQQQQQQQSAATAFDETLDNLRNLEMEQQIYAEIDENKANEKLLDMVIDSDENEVYVPVRFARTEAGTFFWTTNLQPVLSTIVPSADEDLLQPAYCYSNKQYPYMQYQDRWAQA